MLFLLLMRRPHYPSVSPDEDESREGLLVRFVLFSQLRRDWSARNTNIHCSYATGRYTLISATKIGTWYTHSKSLSDPIYGTVINKKSEQGETVDSQAITFTTIKSSASLSLGVIEHSNFPGTLLCKQKRDPQNQKKNTKQTEDRVSSILVSPARTH
jgi:hypothetical protein